MIKKLLKEFDFLKQFRTQNICDSFDRVGSKLSILLQTNGASLIELCGLTNKHSKEVHHLSENLGHLANSIQKLTEKVKGFESDILKKSILKANDIMEPFNEKFREAKAYYEEQIYLLQAEIAALKNQLKQKEVKNENIHRTTKRKQRNVKKGKTLYDLQHP